MDSYHRLADRCMYGILADCRMVQAGRLGMGLTPANSRVAISGRHLPVRRFRLYPTALRTTSRPSAQRDGAAPLLYRHPIASVHTLAVIVAQATAENRWHQYGRQISCPTLWRQRTDGKPTETGSFGRQTRYWRERLRTVSQRHRVFKHPCTRLHRATHRNSGR